jgi:hypothetical protein
MNCSRRSFLYAAGGIATLTTRETTAVEPESIQEGRKPGPVPHPQGGLLGLELYTVRNELKKDLAGTLKTVREWGFEHLELAGLPQLTPEDTSRALGNAGLHAVSMFVDYEPLRGDFAGTRRRSACGSWAGRATSSSRHFPDAITRRDIRRRSLKDGGHIGSRSTGSRFQVVVASSNSAFRT